MSKSDFSLSRAEQMFLWRIRLKLSQKQMSKKLGISQGYISHIELNERRVPDAVDKLIPNITDVTPGEKFYMMIRRNHLTAAEVIHELNTNHTRFLEWVRGQRTIPRSAWTQLKELIAARKIPKKDRSA